MCPVYAPDGGTTRPRPVRGRFGPHRAQFGRKERKQPSPEISRQRRRRICQRLTSHQAHGFLKTSSGERCEKQAGERPGVAHRRPVPGHFARRAGRSGIFPRRQFPHFPGSVWRPWGHDRGQKEKISRWQAIFPSVAAGVNERMKKKYGRKRFETEIRSMDPSLPAGRGGFPLQKRQLRQPQRVYGKGPAVLHGGTFPARKTRDYLAHVIPTDEQAQYFLNALSEEHILYHAFYVLAIYTGCRRGELCALRWERLLLCGPLHLESRSLPLPQCGAGERRGGGAYQEWPQPVP